MPPRNLLRTYTKNKDQYQLSDIGLFFYSANRYYVLTDGDFYMYVEVSYLLSDPFDLEFSVETM